MRVIETPKPAGKMTVPRAISILKSALVHAEQQPVDSPEVSAALDHLAGLMKNPWPVNQARDALKMTNPTGRWQNFNASINAIELAWQNRHASG